jgi:3-hydroxy-5-methyl-1-naphthoate 3-O-methyltransferase
MNLTSAPTTDPTAILRSRDCLYGDDMLVAGLVWMDFFTWLHQQSSATATDIQQHFQIHPRPTDVMLTMFRARGYLVKSGEHYSLTTEAIEHLTSGSPWFLGPYYASLKDRPVAKDILRVLQTDRPANWGSQQDVADWHQAMETDAFAEQFTAAMDCRGLFLAQAAAKKLDFSRHHHLLDIAGGSAIYACSFVEHHPHLHATVLEKPPVDQIARKAIAKRGFTDRVDVHAADMLQDPLPTDADIHLFSNVLHDWDEPVVRQLLAASYAALPAGGMLIVHDAFLNADKSGPLHVAEYSVMLMHATQGRCFGTGEIGAWAEACGFHSVQYQDTAAARGILTASK